MPELQSLIARSCFARVLLLANGDEPAALVEQQPAIAGRVVGFETDHHDVGAIGKLTAELADGFGAKERRIAIEDDHRAAEADKGSLRRLDRIRRAALLSLGEDLTLGIGALRNASHLVHARADHHADLADRGALGGVQHMNEHRRAGDGMHHLRDVRFHPGALAGGKDDGENRILRHASSIKDRRLVGRLRGVESRTQGHRPRSV